MSIMLLLYHPYVVVMLLLSYQYIINMSSLLKLIISATKSQKLIIPSNFGKYKLYWGRRGLNGAFRVH